MRSSKIFLYQSLGFLAVIALSWINEVLGLRTLILGDHPYISDFRESTLEMLFILAIWFVVMGSTRRLFSRVRHLEGFLKVCAWCRRVGSNGRWVPLETFFDEKLDTRTSHSICEDCLRKQEAAADEILRSKQAAAAPAT